MTKNSRYIGRMKQPLQHPDTDNPTMFLLTDRRKHELDLILLTPGFFLHAYNLIVRYNTERVRLFLPSFGLEYISDLYNLYKELYHRQDIEWVFPKMDSYNVINRLIYPNFEMSTFTQFFDGQRKSDYYIHPDDNTISISYIKNPHVIGLYDIIARTEDEVNYFANYITKEKALELFDDKNYDLIHVPYASTLYGGMNYKKIVALGTRYKQKFVPNSFCCEEEYNEAYKDWRGRNGSL